MSLPLPSTLSTAAGESARLRQELEAKTLLIQDIRRDLIHAQITVLDLNDTILRKDTEKADAISILAQLEQVLEEKINHIFELDRVLNQKIAGLQQALAAETAAKTARDEVIQDLVRKIDTANREIGAAHTLAGNYARDLALTREQLQRTTDELADTKATLTATAQELAATQATLHATQQDLTATADARAALAHEVRGMRATLSWRLTTPFRKLRRLFS